MKKDVFGAIIAPEKEKPIKEKPKSSFPDLSLIKGLHKQEATSESVFWHKMPTKESI